MASFARVEGRPGTFVHIARDSAANNSRTLTVPAGLVWDVQWAHVRLVSNTTVGDRHLFVEILDDAANVIWISKALNFQAASLTGEYNIIPGNHEALQNVTLTFVMPFPTTAVLPPGAAIRVRDGNNVSATDTLIFTLAYFSSPA